MTLQRTLCHDLALILLVVRSFSKLTGQASTIMMMESTEIIFLQGTADADLTLLRLSLREREAMAKMQVVVIDPA